MRKWIAIGTSLVLIIIVLILFLISSTPKQVKAVVVLKDYTITSKVEDVDQISVPILLNQKSSYFSDPSQIEKAYLSNISEEDFFQVKVNNISFLDQKVKIKKDKYSMAVFECEIDFHPSDEMSWYFPELYLNLNFRNQVHAKMKIGKMSYNKVTTFSQDQFSLSTIRGTTTTQNNNIFLSGMFLGFRNQSTQEIILQKVTIMDHNLHIGNDISEIKEYNEKLTEEDVLTKDKETLEPIEENLQIHLAPLENKIFYFPILYDDLYVVQSFSIKINYLYANEERVCYIEPYLFFINHYESIEQDKITIYQYES